MIRNVIILKIIRSHHLDKILGNMETVVALLEKFPWDKMPLQPFSWSLAEKKTWAFPAECSKRLTEGLRTELWDLTALAFYFEQNSWVTQQAREGTTGQGRPLSSKWWFALLYMSQNCSRMISLIPFLSCCWGIFGFFISPSYLQI